MSTPDKCPHCRAIRVEGREYACGFIFREGVKNNPRTHECLLNSEVSAHAATKRELDQARAECGIAHDQRRDEAHRAEKAEARVRELEGLAIGNESEGDGGRWFEVFIPIERLGGADCEGEESPTLGDAMPRKDP